MSEKINFEVLLNTAVKVPVVKIEQTEFLKSVLTPHFDEDTVNKAISVNPAYAGITIDKIE